MATFHFQRIPRFPKLDAREGQRLVAGGDDDLNEAPAAPPKGLQLAVRAAIQNKLVMRPSEETALDLIVSHFRLPRPFRLVHLRIKEPLGRRDAQSRSASAGNGECVEKAVVVIQFEQHPANAIGGNRQRTFIPFRMFQSKIGSGCKRMSIVRKIWNRVHMLHGHAGDRAIKLRRNDGRTQQMGAATVFHYRRGDSRLLERNGIGPSFAAAGFVAPRKFARIQCHRAGRLNSPAMFADGKTRQ